MRVPELATLSPRTRQTLLFAGAVVLAAIAYLVNLRAAVDFDLDEVMYTIAGRNVAGHGSLSWAADPIAVHPPLHFLLLGAWAVLTGTVHGPPLDAIFTARWLGALVSVANVVMVGLLCRLYCRNSRAVAAAMALAIVDGFLLRFGRTALIEPTAILAGLIVVYLALRLRYAATARYVTVVGAVSGVALLVKEPLLFFVLVPVLAAALERDPAFLRRSGAAVLVGGLIWTVFPIWAALGGAGGWWWSEHRTNLDRLAGFLQASGMNRPGVSSTGVFGTTFAMYASGYLIFAAGAVGLLRLAWTAGVLRRRAARSRPASLVAFGVLSFGFLGYCVLFGQANEQLTAYSAAPAVLLAVLGWGTPMPRAVVAATTVLFLAGVAAWVGNVALTRDDATSRMGRYLTTYDACAPVNATGDAQRWLPVLPRNRVASQADGVSALGDGVRLFLLSRKDSAMRYGVSSPELDAWVRRNGQPVQQFESRRYRTIELWSVAADVPAVAGSACFNPAAPVASNASVGRFLGLLSGALLLVCATGFAAARHSGGTGVTPARRTSAGSRRAEIGAAAASRWAALRNAAGSRWAEIRATAARRRAALRNAAGSRWAKIRATAARRWAALRNAAGSRWAEIRATAARRWAALRNAAAARWAGATSRRADATAAAAAQWAAATRPAPVPVPAAARDVAAARTDALRNSHPEGIVAARSGQPDRIGAAEVVVGSRRGGS